MKALTSSPREPENNVNPEMAASDARALYQAGEGKWVGVNDKKFIQIFAERSFAHLGLVAQQYKTIPENKKGHSLEEAIKHESSGHFEAALMILVEAGSGKLPEYYATRLYTSMKGIGTKDRALVHAVAMHSHAQMDAVKLAFAKKYGKTLTKTVHSDTSGNYRKLLLALIGPENAEAEAAIAAGAGAHHQQRTSGTGAAPSATST